jgi:hypothetical protein
VGDAEAAQRACPPLDAPGERWAEGGMDPVGGLSEIMRLLQRRLAEKKQQTERLEPTGGQVGTPARRATTAAKASPEEIQRRIGERIQMLGPEERQGPRAAQVFVESVLAWEFGEEVLDDPDFAELTRQVRATMTDDPMLWRKVQGMLADF